MTEATSLKGYGRGYLDIMSDPALEKRLDSMMMRELRRELGIIGLLKMWWGIRKEVKRMEKHDWSRLTKRGLTNSGFLNWLTKNMAAIKSLTDMLGVTQASEVYKRIWDRTAYDLMTSEFPSVSDFKACSNSFESFKEYMWAFNTNNERNGLYEIEVVEDSGKVFACNFKYCVWCEVAKEFGDAYLCYPASCYPDEVWMPKYTSQCGWKFKRTGTLATGAPFCDFRFERAADDGQNLTK